MSGVRRLILLTVLISGLAVLVPAGASAACGPYTSEASGKDRHWNWAPNVGLRVYTLSIFSYAQRCSGGWTRVRHGIYIDSRAFPYGFPFMFSISTRRSDGVWKRVKSKSGATIFSVEGKQKIQEVLLYQSRYTPRGMRLTDVHVVHCACSIGSGALPIGSKLKAHYHPYYGPEAQPGPG